MRSSGMLTQPLISWGGVTASALQTYFGVIWLMLVRPDRPIALSSSSSRISSIRTRPAVPPAARPQPWSRPRATTSAPIATALRMSLPRWTPPSTTIRALPWTTETISASMSMLPRAWSSWRPPWLETQITSTPCWRAISASSAVWTPLSMNGRPALAPTVAGHVDGQGQGRIAGLFHPADDVLDPLHVAVDVELKDLGGWGGRGGLLKGRLGGRAHDVHDAELGRAAGGRHRALRIEDLERADRRQQGRDPQLVAEEGCRRVDL